REERTDEGHVAEDPGFVLDEDHIGPTTDVAQLLVEVRSVEMTHADESHLMASLAQAVADRERVVVDAAALIAREDDDALRARSRQVPTALREGQLQPAGDLLARELVHTPVALLEEILAHSLIAHDALERCRDRRRRLLLEQHASVAERLRDRTGRMGDDRQVAAHGLEERDAEPLVIGEREERGRAAVVGNQLLDGHAAREGHGIVEAELRDLLLEPREVLAGHGGRSDEVEPRTLIRRAVRGEGSDDVVDRLLREDLPDREDRRALVSERARDLGIRHDVALEVLPVANQRADFGLRLPHKEIAAHARRPEHALQLEAVVADRVAVRDDRMELVGEMKPLHDAMRLTRSRQGPRRATFGP